MTAHLILDMPFAEYLAHPALSASGMKQLLDCPARFQYERANPSSSTAAMTQGSLIHHLLFGSDVEYVVKDWDARTNAGKERAAEVEASGAVIVTQDMWDTAEGVVSAVLSDGLAYSLIASGQPEASVFWTDEETGVEMKCRLDFLPDVEADESRYRIPDLKTGRNAHPAKFARQEAELNYGIQRAQQIEAVRALGISDDPESVLIVAETSAPHLVSVIGMSEGDVALARGLREKAIRIYAECTKSGNWPGYSGAITYPDAPIWWRINAEEALGLSSEIEIA